jgi:histidyl-tRNA synthetase
MEASGIEKAKASVPALYIAPMGENAKIKAAAIASALRARGLQIDHDLVGRSLKAQMKYADKTGARYTLILGDSEIESGKGQLRSMSDSSQTEIDLNDIDALAASLK